MISYDMVKVARAPIVACLTCPLCSKLLEEATTISECLHTFCKECIYSRLNDEDLNCCPICDVYLGTTPLDKLRADPQLDEVRSKLFPSNSNKRKALRTSSPPPPVRRKERTLSSLGLVSVPSSSNPSSGGRKSKSHYTRTLASRETSSSEDKAERDSKSNSTDAFQRRGDSRKRSSLSRRPSREASPTPSQSAFSPYVSENHSPANEANKNFRDEKGKSVEQAGFQSPLAYLAELADADAERVDYNGDAEQPSSSGAALREAADIKVREPTGRHAAAREGKLSRPTKGVRRQPSQDKSAFSTYLNGGTDKAGVPKYQAGSSNGVWFVLKAAESQAEDCSLPQISKPYLRISDGRVPVSLVKKYLVRKLDLKQEAEVEITCRGQPVVSSLPLERVRNIWLASPHHAGVEIPALTTSTQQFLMTLTYGRSRRPVMSQ